MKKSPRNRIVFAALSVCLVACKDKQTASLSLLVAERDFLLHPIHHQGGLETKNPHFTMVEIVDVRGSCYEKHVP